MIEIFLKTFNQTLAALAMFNILNGDVSQKDLGEYTSPATINYVETNLEQQGNKLIFDNLSIELPDGVTVEVKTPDSIYANGKEMQIINLIGAEELVGDADSYRGTGPFPPQISLSHYQADYERQETLISALIDLFSNMNLRIQYEDQNNDEYVFRLGSWDYRTQYYYSFVRGENLGIW